MRIEFFKLSLILLKRSLLETAKSFEIRQSLVSLQLKTVKNQHLFRDSALINRKGEILTSLVKKFIEQVTI